MILNLIETIHNYIMFKAITIVESPLVYGTDYNVHFFHLDIMESGVRQLNYSMSEKIDGEWHPIRDYTKGDVVVKLYGNHSLNWNIGFLYLNHPIVCIMGTYTIGSIAIGLKIFLS